MTKLPPDNERFFPDRVNPGRAETRIGGDAIAVWVDVPRWLASRMKTALDRAGIAFEVDESASAVTLPSGTEESIDRFSFPGLAGPRVRGSARNRAARRAQRVVDDLRRE